MNTLKFSCPDCQQHIECDTAYGGTEIQCPTCTASMLVPLADESAAAAGVAPALNIDYSRPEFQGFDEFYRREIEPQMATRQAQQKAARSWALKVGVPGIVVNALVDWWLVRTYGLTDNAESVITAMAFMAIVTVVAAVRKLATLQKAIKGFLLLEVCGFFGFKYCEGVGDVGFNDFLGSDLLPKYDRSKLEDHIHGNHNGVDFDLFECWLEKPSGTDSRGNTTYKNVYHGLLFRFAFPKRFHGRTLVLKDRGLVGNMFKGMMTEGQRIKLEDPRFEKLFEVWGTDQIEARYLLTPTFMERIVELAKAIDSEQLEVCFLNNLLLVSAHVTTNQFEGGDLFTDVGDKRRVEQLVNQICRVFDIVNTLQLTLKTRI